MLEFNLESDCPTPPSSLPGDLIDAYEIASRFVVLYQSCFDWFEMIDDHPGMANLEDEKSKTEIRDAIKKIQDCKHAIAPSLSAGNLFAPEFYREVRYARAELTENFIPPAENPELLLDIVTYDSAFHFLDVLYEVFNESIIRWITNIYRLLINPDNCTKRLTDSTVGHELQYVYGRLCMLPRFEWSGAILVEILKECTAVNNYRIAGKSWEYMDIQYDSSAKGAISSKMRKALEYVKQSGPVKASQVAREIDISVSSYHRHYVKPLKALGVTHTRGVGYFFEED